MPLALTLMAIALLEAFLAVASIHLAWRGLPKSDVKSGAGVSTN